MKPAARPTFFVDSSCIVAALCEWHEHHGQAAAEVDRRLRAHEQLATAAHALAEVYAVLTRLPAPMRLSPADALGLIDRNFSEPARVVALDAEGYRSLLRHVARERIAGGRIYDAIIAECALRAGAVAFLTLNPRHFAQLEGQDVRVVAPAVARA